MLQLDSISDSTVAHLALLVALSALTLAGAVLRRVHGVERSIRPPPRGRFTDSELRELAGEDEEDTDPQVRRRRRP